MKTNDLGNINISLNAISDLAGLTASSVYGVVGLVDKKNISNSFVQYLRKEDFSDGVSVRKNKKGFDVSLYLVVSKEIKIIEVIYEIQKQVSYILKKSFGLSSISVNVFIQAVK